jgi:Coenzyme PQQ synthesis protein D (PqqD)
MTLESVIVATRDQVSAPLGGEAAILQLKDGVYYSLDPVGARIWALLQEPRRVGDLKETLVREFDVSAEQCETDLFELLEKLSGANLIQVLPGAPPDADWQANG